MILSLDTIVTFDIDWGSIRVPAQGPLATSKWLLYRIMMLMDYDPTKVGFSEAEWYKSIWFIDADITIVLEDQQIREEIFSYSKIDSDNFDYLTGQISNLFPRVHTLTNMQVKLFSENVGWPHERGILEIKAEAIHTFSYMVLMPKEYSYTISELIKEQ